MFDRTSRPRRDPVRSVTLTVLAIGTAALGYACADAASSTAPDARSALAPGAPLANETEEVTPGVVKLCKVGAEGLFSVQVGLGATSRDLTMANNSCQSIASAPLAPQDDVIVTIAEKPGTTYGLDHIVFRHGNNAPKTITGERSISFEGAHGANVTFYNNALITVCKKGTAATFDYQIGLGQPTLPLSLADGECRVIGSIPPAGLQDDVIVTVRENGSTAYVLDRMHLLKGLTSTETITGRSSVSFEGVHGAVLTFHNSPVTTSPPPTSTGCTYTQGYYKNKGSSLLPSGNFYASGQTYLRVLDTPPKGGNGYYILAHQFIAATVNAKTASVPSEVQSALEQATAYFTTSGVTPASPYTSAYTKDRLTRLADLLAKYNEGVIGPGHCK